jgi:hypothetical protein
MELHCDQWVRSAAGSPITNFYYLSNSESQGEQLETVTGNLESLQKRPFLGFNQITNASGKRMFQGVGEAEERVNSCSIETAVPNRRVTIIFPLFRYGQIY